MACAAASLSPSSRRVRMAARGTSAAVADMPAEKAEAEPTGAPASLTASAAPELPSDAAANAEAETAAAGAAERCDGFNRCSSTSVSRRRARRCPFAMGLGKPAPAAAGLLQQVASAQRAAEGAPTGVDTATGTGYRMAREEAAAVEADDDAGAVLACSTTEGGCTMPDTAKCPKDADLLLKVDAARSTTETTATTSFFYPAEEGRGRSGWWTCRATTGGRRSTSCVSAVENSSRTNGSSREDDSEWRSTSRSKINSRARTRVTRSSKCRDRDRRPQQSSSRISSSRSSSSTTDKHDVQQRGSSAGSSTRWWIRNKNSNSRVGNASGVLRSSSSQSSETPQRRQSGGTEDSSRRTSLLSSGSRSSSQGEKPRRRRMFLPGSLKNSSSMALEERRGGDGSISSPHAFEEASGTVVGCGGSKAASVSLPCSRCHDWPTARERESNRNSVCCEYLESAEETSSGCLGMGVKHQRCSRSSSRNLEEWCRSPSASSGGQKEGEWRVGSCERLLRRQERFKRPGCGLPLRSQQQEEQVRQPQQDLAQKHGWCRRLFTLGRQGQPEHKPCAPGASAASVQPCCTFATAGDTDREAAVVPGEKAVEKAKVSLEVEAAAAQRGARAAAGGGSAAAYATGAATAANEKSKPEQRRRKQQGQENVRRLQNVLRSPPAAATTTQKQDPPRKKKCFIESLLPHSVGAGKELLQHQKSSRTVKRRGFMGVLQHYHLSSTLLPLRLWRCIHAFSTAAAKERPPLHAREGGSHASGAEAATKQTGQLLTLGEHAAITADSTPAATTKATTTPPNPAATHWPPSSGSDFIENPCSERGDRVSAEADIAEPSAGRDAGWWTAAEEEEADSAPRPCCLHVGKQDDKHSGQRQQQVLARRQGEQKNTQQGHVQRSQQQREVEKDEERGQQQLTLLDQQWRILDVLSYILRRRSEAPVAAHAGEACATSSSGDCVERQGQSEAAGPAGTGPYVCLPQHPSSYWEEVETGTCVSGWSSIRPETAASFSVREGCRDGRLVNAEAPGGTTKATKGEAAPTADASGDRARGKETQGAGKRRKCSILTWTRRGQLGVAKGECSSCEEPGTAEGENASRAQLVCCGSLAPPPATTAPDCCVSSKRTNARVRVAAATALSEGAPAAPAPTAGAAQAAADLYASASRSAQTLVGGELQAALTAARQVDTGLPASDASPAVEATREDNPSVRVVGGQLAVRRSRQRALAAWSRSGVTRGSAAAAVLSMLYLLLQMPCSTKTAVGWLVLLSSCFTLGVQLLRLVQQHGLVVLLPTPFLRLLEENRLMDIIYVQLASGRLSFYISRMLLLLFAHPTREEALSLLEGWHPAVVKLLTGRGLKEALPQQLLRPLYGQAAASPTWDDDAAALPRVRLAAAPAAFHMQPAGSSGAYGEACAGSPGAAGLQPLPTDAPGACASHGEVSLAVRAAFGLRDAGSEETVHCGPAEPSAAAAVLPHTVVVGHPFGSSGSDKGFSQTGSYLLEGNTDELLQRNITAERLGGSPAATAPARGRQENDTSRATAACKHSCSRMREEHFQDAESEERSAGCSTDTSSCAKSGSAAGQHERAGRLDAKQQLQDMRRITAQTQTHTIELLTRAHHQLLPTPPQHKQKTFYPPSACERELPDRSQEQQKPMPPGIPDSERGGALYADEASQILLQESELAATRRITCAPHPTVAATATRAVACARATDFFAVPCPFSLPFKLPRCFGWPQGKPFREAAAQRQKRLAGGVGALAGAAAAADGCVSGDRVAGGATTALPGEGSAASAAAVGHLAARGMGSDVRDRISVEKQRPDINHIAVARAPPLCSSAATTKKLLPASSQAETRPLGEDGKLSTPSAAHARMQSLPVLYEPSRLSDVHLQASTEICKLPLRLGPQPALYPPTTPVVLRVLVSRLTSSRALAASIERFKEKLLHFSLFAAFCAALLRHPRIRRVIRRVPVSVIFWLALAFYLYLISPSRSRSSVRRFLYSGGASFPCSSSPSAVAPSSTGTNARALLLPALPAWLARLLRLRQTSKLHSEEATPVCLQHEQLLQEPCEALWKQPEGVLLQEQQQVRPRAQLCAQCQQLEDLMKWKQQQQEIERLPHRQLLQPPLQQQQPRRELVAVGEAVEEGVASSSSDWQDDGLLHEVARPSSDSEQRRNGHSLGNEDLHLRVCKEALQRFLRQHFWLPV